MSIMGPVETPPVDGLAIDFVVESNRVQLNEIVQRLRDGRLRTNIGATSTLEAGDVSNNRPCMGHFQRTDK